MAAGARSAPDSGDSLIMHWRVEMSAVPLLLIDGHNLLSVPGSFCSRDLLLVHEEKLQPGIPPRSVRINRQRSLEITASNGLRCI
jgi:hypothetical protein